MQLKDAIQDFMLECKVRRLVPRTIDNYGKHLRYLTDYLTEEYQLEKLEDVKSAHIKKFLLMKEEVFENDWIKNAPAFPVRKNRGDNLSFNKP